MTRIELLRRVMDAAEALSTAMVNSELKGADYSRVERPWLRLTEAIQAVYAERSKEQK